ncbi:MAG: GTP 3',8-cyclase MoaA [Planctomycetes bacterium]|nr:GTP 3',8-cyclase MoaA [Planctomycetota bacterium]
MPLDRFHREINYLRISITDRCNLRCTYCMPLDGLRFAPTEEMLSAREIALVVRAAVDAGFRRFRLTGGEPTLRRDLVEIVREIKSVPGVGELAMTTNALLLPGLAPELAAAGLDRVNIHLDTLDEARLRQVMRFSDLNKVWAGIMAAEAAGLLPIKLNSVIVRGMNDEDVVELARLTIERAWHLRFIELMPLGGGECARYSRDKYVSNGVTRARIEAALGPLTALSNQHPSDESRNFRLPAARGVVGFISPVSEPFCGTCNRMRLTATGKFHLCLLNDDELDVRRCLREDGDLGRIRAVLLAAVGQKPSGHALARGVSSEIQSMYHLGG